MRVLGIDLGTKTMGIALSDPLRITASGIDNFHHNENYDECINEIKKLLIKYKDIDTILIGNPIRMDGSQSNMSLIVNSFKDKLIKQISNTINVLLFDERYSTKIAINELKNKYGKNNHEKIKSEKDKMAAIILVQEYIS